MSRPIPHLPWTRNGSAPKDGPPKRMGFMLAGEVRLWWELKAVECKAEMDFIEKEI